MIALLADEHFPHAIVRETFLHHPAVDFITVQAANLHGTPDPALLEWAARANRVIVTYDVSTLVGFAYERVRRGESMPGVVVAFDHLAIGQVIQDLATIALAGDPSELANQVLFLPL